MFLAQFSYDKRILQNQDQIGQVLYQSWPF